MKMKLNNPKSPATSGQLWYLHLLTGENTRDWKLTKREAFDKITELRAKGKAPAKGKEVEPEAKPKPKAKAKGGK